MLNRNIVLTFDRWLGCNAAKRPIKCHQDWRTKPNSCGFKTFQDLTIRGLTAKLIEALKKMARHTYQYFTKSVDGYCVCSSDHIDYYMFTVCCECCPLDNLQRFQ